MPTKTATPDAGQQLADATQDLDALKAKILAHGAQAVTAQALSDAASRVEHARLSAQHAAQAAVQAQEDQRQQRLEEIKARILAAAGDLEEFVAAMEKIADGVRCLLAYQDRNRAIGGWIAELVQEAVPPAVDDQAADGHAGLGWHRDRVGEGDSVVVDGRAIKYVHPGSPVAVALGLGMLGTEYEVGILGPIVAADAVGPAATDDPRQWLAKRH